MDGGSIRSYQHAPRASANSSEQREARVGEHQQVGKCTLAQPQGEPRQVGVAGGYRTASEIC